MVNQQRGYLVAYDVSDDYRRTHIAKILQHYGERLQYSVFLLRVRPSMMLDVRMQVEQEIDGSTDSVVFCSLGTIAQTEEGLDFLGHRGYTDLDIPTVI